MTTAVAQEQKLSIVGTSVPRIDDVPRATAGLVFGADFRLPGMLHVKVLRSPHAHARLGSIDISRAQRLPGVRLVLTGADCDYRFGSYLQDEPVLARDKVRYSGEGVAAVCAGYEETAEEALELIRVEYEPLPAVFTTQEAIRAGAPLVHEAAHLYHDLGWVKPVPGTNIVYHFKLRKGDLERGFGQSYRVFEHTFTTDAMQHAPLEPHVAVAQADTEGRLTFWTGTQSPWECRANVMEGLDLAPGDVRVIALPVGGAFGSKMYARLEPLLGAFALRLPGKPIRLLFTREEEFGSAVVRPATTSRIKTGVSREGLLLAREVESYWDAGGYADCTPNVCRNGGFQGAGPYRIPNVKADAYCVYTNNPISGALRGYAAPQVIWAYESQMDLMARDLGIDPLELRLRNAFDLGDETATGEVLRTGVGLKETIHKAAAALNWSAPKDPPSSPTRRRGRGLATIFKHARAPSTSSAFIKMHEDGAVEILKSSVELGQGANTILAQIVAEVLQVPLGRVRVANPDTDFTPFDRSSSSSRTTFYMGNAVRLAAEDIRQQLVEMASEVFEAPQELVRFEGGQVVVPGKEALPYARLINRYYGATASVVGRATYGVRDAKPLDPETGQSPRAVAFYMYATQGVELEVDTETGAVELLKVTAAHDVGKAINPLHCVQQIEGALAMGFGSTLTERLEIEAGKVQNGIFSEYHVPTSLDMPQGMVPILVEAPHAEGPFGAKGVGETGLAPTAAAIANALLDATGISITALPLLQERVQRALAPLRERRES